MLLDILLHLMYTSSAKNASLPVEKSCRTLANWGGFKAHLVPKPCRCLNLYLLKVIFCYYFYQGKLPINHYWRNMFSMFSNMQIQVKVFERLEWSAFSWWTDATQLWRLVGGFKWFHDVHCLFEDDIWVLLGFSIGLKPPSKIEHMNDISFDVKPWILHIPRRSSPNMWSANSYTNTFR